MISLVLYALLGLTAGLLSGLLGIGGGVIFVPALVYLFSNNPAWQPFAMHLATSTSLAVVIFSTGMASISQAKRQGINYTWVRLYAPGMLLGVVFGIYSAHLLSSDTLALIFGIFTAFFSVYLFFRRFENTTRHWQCAPIVHRLISIPIGVFAGLLGLGGGVLLVPLFFLFGVNVRQMSGTSAILACCAGLLGTAISIFKAPITPQLGMAFIGNVNWVVAIILGLTSILSVPIGVKWAHTLSPIRMRRCFAILLGCIAVRMMFS